MKSTTVWRTDGNISWQLYRTQIFPATQKTEAQCSARCICQFTCLQPLRLLKSTQIQSGFWTALKQRLSREMFTTNRVFRVNCSNEFRTRKIASSCKTFVSRRLTKGFCYWNYIVFVSTTSMVFQSFSKETLPGLDESSFLAFALSKIKTTETILAIKTEGEAQELTSSFLIQMWSSDSRLCLSLGSCSCWFGNSSLTVTDLEILHRYLPLGE